MCRVPALRQGWQVAGEVPRGRQVTLNQDGGWGAPGPVRAFAWICQLGSVCPHRIPLAGQPTNLGAEARRKPGLAGATSCPAGADVGGA